MVLGLAKCEESCSCYVNKSLQFFFLNSVCTHHPETLLEFYLWDAYISCSLDPAVLFSQAIHIYKLSGKRNTLISI